ncbi:glucosyl-3-phosphoglycerate synthase [Rhabdothermincola sp.]|uniref:glucosyl-3-phosphoglycerate synthase n=1 Tax=Rhabdothermincola sp. TaxID=2820405 RepID=UPI003FA76A1F
MSGVLVPVIRTFRADEFAPGTLVEAKRGQRVSVCLPARNEAGRVGPIVERIRAGLVRACPLVDELIVVDDHSTDSTAAEARDAGATVVDAAAVLPSYGTGHGKGEALWKSLFVSSGDLVVWCDADIAGFDPAFVVGLLGPLLTRDDVDFVKGFYERPLDGEPSGGGRVTELVARPLLAQLFPKLTSVVQPLAGEYAGRRELLEQLPFAQGYGVDIGLLIDVAERFGTERIAQVDLGVRRHRNRPLGELAPQAAAVLQAVLQRAEPRLGQGPAVIEAPGYEPVEVRYVERPPMTEVPAYRRARSSA